ncbi:MAG: M48 family metalloprotease [Treponema sp.]|jgi:predicted Zn-dependent protease|nr:M48 family metalloprotease [Treponema sp.]
MKTHNKTPVFAGLGILAALVLVFGSCRHLAAVAGAGAQIAGAAGVIDQNTANAISKSSQAVGSAAEDITPEQEYYIGRAVGANILTNYKLWNGSPALTAYLNRICRAITINSPKPEIFNGYHVMILDSNEINAFATSGGHIFITRGLIAGANSEDALAGVIAHEIAHIQLQHSIKAIKTSRITQALLVTGTSAAGAAAGYDVNELTDVFNESVGEIVTTMVNNGYSQNQEFDADSTALELLASSGYNPSGLIDMLKTLDKIQGGSSGGFNKTHPRPAQRINSAEKSLNKYKVADTGSFRRERYAAFAAAGH